jgi:hypothetical protein
MIGCSPAEALFAMAAKHLVSITDMIDMSSDGHQVDQGMIDEKIGDAVNYMLLLWAMMTEEQERRRS